MIRNVLFDLDDTLFDFHKAEKIALTKTLVHFGIDPTEETLALYSTINAAHWKRLELGEISREEVKVGRYRELFKTIGVECDPVKATAYYESMLAIGHYFMPGAPELPCFGVKFETTAPVVRTCWTGLAGETYPDRCKGGVFGCHEETPHVEPHLVPQDCGMHMQTRQAMLEQRDACGHTTAALTLQQVDAPFAFSALPNTAQEIAATQHITELPATGRTSVMVLGAVRGGGGIDSWGTDVEEPYHVSGEEDHSVSFRIVL